MSTAISRHKVLSLEGNNNKRWKKGKKEKYETDGSKPFFWIQRCEDQLLKSQDNIMLSKLITMHATLAEAF